MMGDVVNFIRDIGGGIIVKEEGIFRKHRLLYSNCLLIMQTTKCHLRSLALDYALLLIEAKLRSIARSGHQLI
jgi:hypothetical protein